MMTRWPHTEAGRVDAEESGGRQQVRSLLSGPLEREHWGIEGIRK